MAPKTAKKKTPATKSVAALEKELKATMAKLAKAKAKEKAAKPAAKKAKKASAKKVVAKYNPKTAKTTVKKVKPKAKKPAHKLSKQDEVRALLAPRKATTKCVFCGSTKFGDGCHESLNGLHKHNTDDRRCMYCGKTEYGFGCLGAPNRRHIHGSGRGKCKWCGKTTMSNSMGCSISPNRKHET